MSFNFTSSPLYTPSLSPSSTASYLSSDAPSSPPGIYGMPPSPSPANRAAPPARSLRMEKGHPLQELFMILYLGGACSEQIQRHGAVVAQCAQESRRTGAAKRAERVGRVKLAGRVERTKLGEQLETTRPNKKSKKNIKTKRPTSKPSREIDSLKPISPSLSIVTAATSLRRKRTLCQDLPTSYQATPRVKRQRSADETLVLDDLEWSEKRVATVSYTGSPVSSSPSAEFSGSSPTVASLLGKRARRSTAFDLSNDCVDVFFPVSEPTTPQMDVTAEYEWPSGPFLNEDVEESSRLVKKVKYCPDISLEVTAGPCVPSVRRFRADCILNWMEARKSEHRQQLSRSQRQAESIFMRNPARSVDTAARLCSDQVERSSSCLTSNSPMVGPYSRPLRKRHQILPPAVRPTRTLNRTKADLLQGGRSEQMFNLGFLLVVVLFFVLVNFCLYRS